VSTLPVPLRGIRWAWVLLAGLAANVATVAAFTAVVAAYGAVLAALSRGHPDPQRIDWLASQSVWVAPALGLILTGVAGAVVGRRAPRSPITHGALVGLAAAVAGVFAGKLFGGSQSWVEAAWFGGSVGAGWLGGLEARTGIAGREELYGAASALGRARSAEDVVAAIGEALAGEHVRLVALFGPPERDGDPLHEMATWGPTGGGPWPAGAAPRADDLPATLRERGQVVRRIPLPVSGARCAYLAWLNRPTNGRRTLLVVACGGRRLSRGTLQALPVIGEQAAVVLENLRLIDQGKRLGALMERQRLSGELHDTLAQGLASIVMHLEAADQALCSRPELAARHLDWARRTARENLAESRRLVWALRPEALEKETVPDALKQVAKRCGEEVGIRVDAEIVGTPRLLSTDVEAVLLRAGQEALSNVRKHARAQRAVLTLSYMDAEVMLDVQDDGVGMEGVPEGVGLSAMRRRAEHCGGRLEITGRPGGGTSLLLSLPVDEAS
jgi:signal transduction histidine kinase